MRINDLFQETYGALAANKVRSGLTMLGVVIGITSIVVTYDVAESLKVADYAYVMESGKIVLDGPKEDLIANEDVKEFYLGGGSGARKSFKNLKSFRRRKRWI